MIARFNRQKIVSPEERNDKERNDKEERLISQSIYHIRRLLPTGKGHKVLMIMKAAGLVWTAIPSGNAIAMHLQSIHNIFKK